MQQGFSAKAHPPLGGFFICVTKYAVMAAKPMVTSLVSTFMDRPWGWHLDCFAWPLSFCNRRHQDIHRKKSGGSQEGACETAGQTSSNGARKSVHHRQASGIHLQAATVTGIQTTTNRARTGIGLHLSEPTLAFSQGKQLPKSGDFLVRVQWFASLLWGLTAQAVSTAANLFSSRCPLARETSADKQVHLRMGRV